MLKYYAALCVLIITSAPAYAVENRGAFSASEREQILRDAYACKLDPNDKGCAEREEMARRMIFDRSREYVHHIKAIQEQVRSIRGKMNK